MSQTKTSVAAGGWVVLGLLVQRAPQTGYDLASLSARSIGHFWPVTKAQIYAELPKLEAAGLATGDVMRQIGAPDKRLYRPTEAGRAAFARWLRTAKLGAPRLRHPLLLRVWFGTSLEPAAFKTLLAEAQAAVADERARFEALLEKLEATRAPRAEQKGRNLRRLALRHALLRLAAEAEWLEEVAAAV